MPPDYLLHDLLRSRGISVNKPGRRRSSVAVEYHCRNQDSHVDLRAPFQTLMETMRFMAIIPMNIIDEGPCGHDPPDGLPEEDLDVGPC